MPLDSVSCLSPILDMLSPNGALLHSDPAVSTAPPLLGTAVSRPAPPRLLNVLALWRESPPSSPRGISELPTVATPLARPVHMLGISTSSVASLASSVIAAFCWAWWRLLVRLSQMRLSLLAGSRSESATHLALLCWTSWRAVVVSQECIRSRNLDGSFLVASDVIWRQSLLAGLVIMAAAQRSANGICAKAWAAWVRFMRSGRRLQRLACAPVLTHPRLALHAWYFLVWLDAYLRSPRFRIPPLSNPLSSTFGLAAKDLVSSSERRHSPSRCHRRAASAGVPIRVRERTCQGLSGLEMPAPFNALTSVRPLSRSRLDNVGGVIPFTSSFLF